ncbi:MAG: hypothetical protein DSY33_00915 [Archaeoglobus sp.]|nr:MAG: hypothetical protein DSY33_00915 [Archaeoglobus sp.]
MPSWSLHKHWAEKIGLDTGISEKVDRIIDGEWADIRGGRLREKLNEAGLLEGSIKEETFRAVTLHNIMDCLRDFIWELGREPVSLIPPKKNAGDRVLYVC